MNHLARLAILIFVVLGTSCSREEVRTVSERVHFSPAELSFGDVPKGMTTSKFVELHNEGASRFDFEIRELPEGILVEPQKGTVPAGKSLRLQVWLVAKGNGSVANALVLRSKRSKSEHRLKIGGNVVPQALEVTDLLDFEDVYRGKAKKLELPVRSLVDVELDVRLSLSQSGEFSVHSNQLRLEPRESAVLEVEFAPVRRGPVTSRILLAPCLGCEEEQVVLQGRGLDYGIQVAPEALQFGRVWPGYTATKDLEVWNTGDGPVSLAAPSWSSSGQGGFSVDGLGIENPLHPGSSGVVRVAFSPEDFGYAEAELLFTDDEGVELARAKVSGLGGGAYLRVSPPAVDFGLRPLGLYGSKVALVERGGAPEPVEIFSIAVEGPDADLVSVAAPALPFSIEDDAVELEIALHPDRPGNLRAEVVLETNLPGQPRVAVPVHAQAIQGEECNLEPSRSAVRFGLAHQSVEHSRRIEFENKGQNACFIWNVEVQGLHAQFFPIEPAFEPLFLDPGEKWSVEVKFEAEDAPPFTYLDATLMVQGGPVGASPVELPIVAMKSDTPTHNPFPVEVTVEDTPVGRVVVVSVVTGTYSTSYFSYRLTEDSSAAFSFPGGQKTHSIAGCDLGQCTVKIAFAPEDEGLHRATLEKFWDGTFFAPVYVEIEANAVAPCDDCDWPSAQCELAESMEIGQVQVLEDDASYECNWQSVEPDVKKSFSELSESSWLTESSGFRLKVDSAKPCSGTFAPYTVGSYTLSNLRVREDGRAAYCETEVEATAPDGLWVEIGTKGPHRGPYGTDESLGLFVLHGDGGAPTERSSWFEDQFVCKGYADKVGGHTCSWGSVGQQDDPVFPETNIYSAGFNIEAPEVGKQYHLGVFGRPSEWGSSIPVELRVFCGKQLIATQTIQTALANLIVAGTVEIGVGGACTYTPDGVTVFPWGRSPED